MSLTPKAAGAWPVGEGAGQLMEELARGLPLSLALACRKQAFDVWSRSWPTPTDAEPMAAAEVDC